MRILGTTTREEPPCPATREKSMHQQRPNAAKVSKIIFFKLIHIKKKKNLRKAKTKTPTDKRCPEEQTGTSGNESDAGNTAVLETVGIFTTV